MHEGYVKDELLIPSHVCIANERAPNNELPVTNLDAGYVLGAGVIAGIAEDGLEACQDMMVRPCPVAHVMSVLMCAAQVLRWSP